MKRSRRGNGGSASSVIPSPLTRKGVNNITYRVCRGEPERAFNGVLLNPREVFSKIALTTSEEKAAFSHSFAPRLPVFPDFVSSTSNSENVYEDGECDCVQPLIEKPNHDENIVRDDSTRDTDAVPNYDITSNNSCIDLTNDSTDNITDNLTNKPSNDASINSNINGDDSIPKSTDDGVSVTKTTDSDNDDIADIIKIIDEDSSDDSNDDDETYPEERTCVGCGQVIEGVSIIVCQRSCPHFMCKSCLNEAINREIQWYLHTEWERPTYVSFHCPACNSIVSVMVASGAAGFPFIPLKKSKIPSEKMLFDSWLDISKKINALEDTLSNICKVVDREASRISSISSNTRTMISKSSDMLDSIGKSVLSTMDGLEAIQEKSLLTEFPGFTRASLSQKFSLMKEISVSILSTLKFILLSGEPQKKESNLEKLSESLGERISIVYRILVSISIENLFKGCVEDIVNRNENTAKKPERPKHPNQHVLRNQAHEHEKNRVQSADGENMTDVISGNDDSDDDADVIFYNFDEDDNDSGGDGDSGKTKSRISFKDVQFPRTLNESILKVELALSDIKRQNIHMNEKDSK